MLDEEELFYNTSSTKVTLEFTRVGLFNALQVLGQIPGVSEVGIHGEATYVSGEKDIIKLNLKTGDGVKIYVPEIRLKSTPGAGITFLPVEEIVDLVTVILESSGMTKMKKGNPLAGMLAFEMIDSGKSLGDTIIEYLRKQIIPKAELADWCLPETSFRTKFVPVSGKILIEPGFHFENKGAKPECFGEFSSSSKTFDFPQCKSLGDLCCSKLQSRDDLLDSIAAKESLPICYHCRECKYGKSDN
jgi:hypothetical protein